MSSSLSKILLTEKSIAYPGTAPGEGCQISQAFSPLLILLYDFQFFMGNIWHLVKLSHLL